MEEAESVYSIESKEERRVAKSTFDEEALGLGNYGSNHKQQNTREYSKDRYSRNEGDHGKGEE